MDFLLDRRGALLMVIEPWFEAPPIRCGVPRLAPSPLTTWHLYVGRGSDLEGRSWKALLGMRVHALIVCAQMLEQVLLGWNRCRRQGLSLLI